MNPAALVPLDGSGPLDLVFGLPAHPLIVHLPIVVLPAAALALIAIVLVPRFRPAFGWVVIAGLAVGAGGSLLAKESGESLAARVGWPGDHAQLGDRLPLLAFALLAAAVLWFFLMRRDLAHVRQVTAGQRTLALTRIVAAVACLLAVATIALTVAVGHSGAVSVWSARLQESTPTASAPALNLAEVARHNSADDCWSVVQGQVYDLTSWIDQHPGGDQVILEMCGLDATNAFLDMHGSSPGPQQTLAGFLIGPLVP